ncbi:MAG: 4a-hydroxytetrahydrobiopterin dehydratase [Betaproteobacteria bacterium]|nr:4a-hydroxytetrahydrobiopterin dehydratase [Betaproteobacteria bacterium]
METSCNLADRQCQSCEGGVTPLDAVATMEMLCALPGWTLNDQRLEKTFGFRNHYEAMAFVNAIAWISHHENHHPELTVGYKDVRICYWTHAIGGLSENDFICAAKVEKLLDL